MLTEHVLSAGAGQINLASGPAAGPPLLLVHGGMNTWRIWDPLIPDLAQHYHVIAMDLRGHGRSSRTPGHYRVKDFAADVTAVLQKIGGAPGVLVGHSLGGAAALDVAAKHPELVRELVLLDPPLDISYTRAHPGTRGIFSVLRDILEQHETPAAIAQAMAERTVELPGVPGPVPLAELPGYHPEELALFDPEVLAWMQDGRLIAGYEPLALLEQLTVRTLLLRGDPNAGGMIPDAVAASAERPGVTVIDIPGAGHELPVEAPELVLRAIRQHLMRPDVRS